MMKGLDVFKDYFQAYSEQYVLIGGAACDIIFEEQDAAFRATKDLDLVLIVEALTPDFGQKFWQFIHDGGYENRAKSSGTPQFYRFDKPKNPSFPYMIELFSRVVETFQGEAAGPLVPLPLSDEISSLSAILLNEDYYALILNGRILVSELVVLSPTYLIPFKAKAWLDLSERKSQGQHVDEKDIRKHKNDIIRLATLLNGSEKCELSETVRQDMSAFVEKLRQDPVDPKSLKITGIRFEDILDVLRQVYFTD
ncbi:MAG: hypothetical protein VB106_02405 [Clostridiaceae bacterium]|nr:hypothetical protein [Clostridiaceae bacterium]